MAGRLLGPGFVRRTRQRLPGHAGDDLVVLVTPHDSIPAEFVGHYDPEVADKPAESTVVGHYGPEVADKSAHYELVVSAGFAWNREGSVRTSEDGFVARHAPRHPPDSRRGHRRAGPLHRDASRAPGRAPGRATGVSVGRPRDLAEIRAALDAAEGSLRERAEQYGDLSDAYLAVTSGIAWNTRSG